MQSNIVFYRLIKFGFFKAHVVSRTLYKYLQNDQLK